MLMMTRWWNVQGFLLLVLFASTFIAQSYLSVGSPGIILLILITTFTDVPPYLLFVIFNPNPNIQEIKAHHQGSDRGRMGVSALGGSSAAGTAAGAATDRAGSLAVPFLDKEKGPSSLGTSIESAGSTSSDMRRRLQFDGVSFFFSL